MMVDANKLVRDWHLSSGKKRVDLAGNKALFCTPEQPATHMEQMGEDPRCSLCWVQVTAGRRKSPATRAQETTKDIQDRE